MLSRQPRCPDQVDSQYLSAQDSNSVFSPRLASLKSDIATGKEEIGVMKANMFLAALTHKHISQFDRFSFANAVNYSQDALSAAKLQRQKEMQKALLDPRSAKSMGIRPIHISDSSRMEGLSQESCSNR